MLVQGVDDLLRTLDFLVPIWPAGHKMMILRLSCCRFSLFSQCCFIKLSCYCFHLVRHLAIATRIVIVKAIGQSFYFKFFNFRIYYYLLLLLFINETINHIQNKGLVLRSLSNN